jgi:hypothetical protein
VPARDREVRKGKEVGQIEFTPVGVSSLHSAKLSERRGQKECVEEEDEEEEET